MLGAGGDWPKVVSEKTYFQLASGKLLESSGMKAILRDFWCAFVPLIDLNRFLIGSIRLKSPVTSDCHEITLADEETMSTLGLGIFYGHWPGRCKLGTAAGPRTEPSGQGLARQSQSAPGAPHGSSGAGASKARAEAKRSKVDLQLAAKRNWVKCGKVVPCWSQKTSGTENLEIFGQCWFLRRINLDLLFFYWPTSFCLRFQDGASRLVRFLRKRWWWSFRRFRSLTWPRADQLPKASCRWAMRLCGIDVATCLALWSQVYWVASKGTEPEGAKVQVVSQFNDNSWQFCWISHQWLTLDMRLLQSLTSSRPGSFTKRAWPMSPSGAPV